MGVAQILNPFFLDPTQDEAERNNHLRVARVNSYLKERGLSCWFDEDCLEGDIEEAMCAGIDSSSIVIVFITDRCVES
jgi:hypothetical protein